MLAAFLLIPLLSIAHIIQDDVSVTDRAAFSLASVCKKMVSHESPLIDIASGTEIECMGKKVEIAEFCDKEMAADPYYIRAYIDKENKQVVCQSGKKVLFKYLCVKMSEKHYCNGKARQNCLSLKAKIAKRLDLVHSSQVKNEKGIPQLNCFFEPVPLNESL
ncbi:MAG TPA: hypothetical protein VNJ08_06840 [Bacteriovoracaceae bacterium]|nr:hypothetical protein [Bacteriovoracaceae bacterium]